MLELMFTPKIVDLLASSRHFVRKLVHEDKIVIGELLGFCDEECSEGSGSDQAPQVLSKTELVLLVQNYLKAQIGPENEKFICEALGNFVDAPPLEFDSESFVYFQFQGARFDLFRTFALFCFYFLLNDYYYSDLSNDWLPM